MRRLIVAIVLLGVLGGGALAAKQVRWSGGLGAPYGNGLGMPVRAGVPFSVGMTELKPGHRVRIESVRLDHPTHGLVLVGALIHRLDRGGVGADLHFPPPVPHVRARPAAGAVVHAHTMVDLIVGIRATRPGRFRVRGFDVLYRERWHSIELRRKAHVGPNVSICAVRTKGYPRCRAPQTNS